MALERQDLSCMYLFHHELESVLIVTVIATSPFAVCTRGSSNMNNSKDA